MESVTTCGRRKGGNKKDPSELKRQARLESLAKNHALHFSIYKTMLILPAKITNSTFASSGNSRTCETSITNTIQSSMRKQKIHCSIDDQRRHNQLPGKPPPVLLLQKYFQENHKLCKHSQIIQTRIHKFDGVFIGQRFPGMHKPLHIIRIDHPYGETNSR